jgi:hypothetical protein
MHEPGIFDWLYFTVMYSVLGCYFFVQIRYLVRRYRRNSWPIADATVQKGSMGKVRVGKYGSIPASFLGYTYNAQGIRYGGYFVLFGKDATIQGLHETLPGQHIQIRYSPSDPNMGLVGDQRTVCPHLQQ